MANPILVIYHNGEFKDTSPCTSSGVEKFVLDYCNSNSINKEGVHVYKYDRKQWVSLLEKSQEDKSDFSIEDGRIFLKKRVFQEEEQPQIVDWTCENDLESFYTQEELQKIEENRVYLNTLRSLSDLNPDNLPHEIPERTRMVLAKVSSYEEYDIIPGEEVVLEGQQQEEEEEEEVVLE